MIPLVGHVNELAETRRLLEAEAEAVREAAGGIDVDYKFGTMIEVPRGAADRRRDRPARRASSASAPTT